MLRMSRQVATLLLCIALTSCLFGRTAAGVVFSRTVEKADGVSFALTFAQGCSSKDAYGSNHCSFSWGQHVDGNVSAALTKPLQKGSVIDIALRIDRFLPFKQVCPVCGGQCTVEVPVVGKRIDIPLPPCPIHPTKITKSFSEALPSKEPVDLKVSVDGVVSVIDQDKKPVLQMKVSAVVAEQDLAAADYL